MYSERLLSFFHHPAHAGPFAAPTAATHRGAGGVVGEGPYVVLWLRVEGEGAAAVVREARFQTYGCAAAIACSEAACAWSEGKPLAELAAATAADVAAWVGGVPEGKEHCPALVAGALASVRKRSRAKPQSRKDEDGIRCRGRGERGEPD